MDTLEHLKAHLKGKVIILGIGSMMRRDDAAGSILASRLEGKVPFTPLETMGRHRKDMASLTGFTVLDAGPSPENYFGKMIREKPDNIIIIDAVDFGGKAGEYLVFEAGDVKTVNLFSTHNASISLAINYLQSNLTAEIIILAIQPRSVAFGEGLSPEIAKTLAILEEWFYAAVKTEG